MNDYHDFFLDKGDILPYICSCLTQHIIHLWKGVNNLDSPQFT